MPSIIVGSEVVKMNVILLHLRSLESRLKAIYAIAASLCYAEALIPSVAGRVDGYDFWLGRALRILLNRSLSLKRPV